MYTLICNFKLYLWTQILVIAVGNSPGALAGGDWWSGAGHNIWIQRVAATTTGSWPDRNQTNKPFCIWQNKVWNCYREAFYIHIQQSHSHSHLCNVIVLTLCSNIATHSQKNFHCVCPFQYFSHFRYSIRFWLWKLKLKKCNSSLVRLFICLIKVCLHLRLCLSEVFNSGKDIKKHICYPYFCSEVVDAWKS